MDTPTLLNNDTIMCRDGDFMTKEGIKKKCDCEHKSECIRAVELLAKNQIKEVMELLNGITD